MINRRTNYIKRTVLHFQGQTFRMINDHMTKLIKTINHERIRHTMVIVIHYYINCDFLGRQQLILTPARKHRPPRRQWLSRGINFNCYPTKQACHLLRIHKSKVINWNILLVYYAGWTFTNNYNHRVKSLNSCQNILHVYEPFVQSAIELRNHLPVYENNELIHLYIHVYIYSNETKKPVQF